MQLYVIYFWGKKIFPSVEKWRGKKDWKIKREIVFGFILTLSMWFIVWGKRGIYIYKYMYVYVHLYYFSSKGKEKDSYVPMSDCTCFGKS